MSTDIKARIRKLLTLARDKGATDNEVAVALRKASDLMLAHNIDESEALAYANEDVAIMIGELGQFRFKHTWQQVLANVTALLYDCKFVGEHSTKDASGFQGMYVGRMHNIEACEATFPFLYDQIEALYQATIKLRKELFGKGMTTSDSDMFRRTFKEAAVVKIGLRVMEIKAAQRGTIPLHKSLVVLDDALAKIEAALEGAGATTKEVAPLKYGSGTGAGAVAGSMVKIQQEVKAGA